MAILISAGGSDPDDPGCPIRVFLEPDDLIGGVDRVATRRLGRCKEQFGVAQIGHGIQGGVSDCLPEYLMKEQQRVNGPIDGEEFE